MKIFSGSISSGNSIIGNDSAANYTSFSVGDISPNNPGGYGIDGWNLVDRVGTNGVYRTSSTSQGFGDINSNGNAWAAFGNPTGNNGINVRRNLPRALSVGFALSAQMAAAFRNPGNKGFSLYTDTDWSSEIYNFNIGSDIYTYNIGSGNQNLGWGYSQTSVFNIVARQTTTTNLQVTVTRGSDTDTRNVTGALRGFKWYIFGTNGGNDLNNIFYNNIAVYRF